MKRLLFLAAALVPLLLVTPTSLPPAAQGLAAESPPAARSAPPAVVPAARPTPKMLPAAAITITVPDGELVPGEDYDLGVSGLTLADLTPGKVAFVAPESAACKARLVAQWGLAGLEPVITFRARSAGSYRVLIVKALPAEQLQVAAAVVTVKGAEPDPKPEPDPTPVPGKLDVLIVQETADKPLLTGPQRAILTSQTFRKHLQSKGHNFLGAKDRNLQDSKGNVPTELVPFLAAFSAAGGKTPAIVLRYANGTLKVFPLPADEAATIALLTKEGG